MDHIGKFQNWTVEEWKEFITLRAKEFVAKETRPIPDDLNLEILFAVREMLPSQPWPDGIHKEIAEKLGISNKTVNKYISELIERGDFMPQVDGQLFPPSESEEPGDTEEPILGRESTEPKRGEEQQA